MQIISSNQVLAEINRNYETDESLYYGSQTGSPIEGSVISGNSQGGCAIVVSDKIECWGINDWGQLGNGYSDGYQNLTYHDPVEVSLPDGVITVNELSPNGYREYSNGAVRCAIVNNGSVICWGSYDYNYDGDIDDQVDWISPAPKFIELPVEKRATVITYFQSGMVVILDDGQLYCLESIFRCDYSFAINPILENELKYANSIGGSGLQCIALANLTILCHGIAEPIHHGSMSAQTYWLNAVGNFHGANLWPELSTVSEISANLAVGSSHACWLSPFTGFLSCFGVFGLDPNRYTYDAYPSSCWDQDTNKVVDAHVKQWECEEAGFRFKIADNTIEQRYISISSGSQHVCVLSINGSVYCWGVQNAGGYTHLASIQQIIFPQNQSVTTIHSSGDESCAILVNGTLYCWNFENLKADGDGTPYYTSPPEQIYISSRVQLIDRDYDNDSIMNLFDMCANGERGWKSTENSDFDYDGCKDNTEDMDDDNDGVPDNSDQCLTSSEGLIYPWFSINDLLDTNGDKDLTNDFDMDGCRDADEDHDDDNDGWADLIEINCNKDPLNPFSRPQDNDGDDICDSVDIDDDGDGIIDTEDAFPRDLSEYEDRNGDGLGDNAHPLSILDHIKLNLEVSMISFMLISAFIIITIFRKRL